MGTEFITSLSREAEDKDFRVIAEAGGYGEIIHDLMRQLHGSDPQLAYDFEIYAQRDYTEMVLRITVNRDTNEPDGDDVRFDGSIGQFLDFDGQETGNFVVVRLSIDPAQTQQGQTVGVLRMQHFVRLSTAI